MRKALQIILVVASYAPLSLAQKENSPFLPLDRHLKEQTGGWAGSKQALSNTFNGQRIRLGDKFEPELLIYLSNDIEKHYWVSLFLVAPSYLHGNKPLPHLALLIKQQALSLLRGKSDNESLGDVIRLNVTAAVLSHSLGLLTLGQAYKQDAERLLSTNSDLSAWFPAMDEYEQCLYNWIGKDNSKNSSTARCKKDDTPPEKRARVIRLSGNVLEQKAINKPAPNYPEEAKTRAIEGEVTVEVLIDQNGNIEAARAVSGPQLLQEAAVKAAYKARFHVTTLSGEPVKVIGVITYKFNK